MFPNNGLSCNPNFYATNYERDSGMKDLYDQILPVLSLGRRGMSQERKLVTQKAPVRCWLRDGVDGRRQEMPSWDTPHPGAACSSSTPGQPALAIEPWESALFPSVTFPPSAS